MILGIYEMENRMENMKNIELQPLSKDLLINEGKPVKKRNILSIDIQILEWTAHSLLLQLCKNIIQ